MSGKESLSTGSFSKKRGIRRGIVDLDYRKKVVQKKEERLPRGRVWRIEGGGVTEGILFQLMFVKTDVSRTFCVNFRARLFRRFLPCFAAARDILGCPGTRGLTIIYGILTITYGLDS